MKFSKTGINECILVIHSNTGIVHKIEPYDGKKTKFHSLFNDFSFENLQKFGKRNKRTLLLIFVLITVLFILPMVQVDDGLWLCVSEDGNIGSSDALDSWTSIEFIILNSKLEGRVLCESSISLMLCVITMKYIKKKLKDDCNQYFCQWGLVFVSIEMSII